MPRAGLVRTTAAPGIAAPVESVTTPVMEALSWALRAKGADRRIASMASLATRVLISIFSYGKKDSKTRFGHACGEDVFWVLSLGMQLLLQSERGINLPVFRRFKGRNDSIGMRCIQILGGAVMWKSDLPSETAKARTIYRPCNSRCTSMLCREATSLSVARKGGQDGRPLVAKNRHFVTK